MTHIDVLCRKCLRTLRPNQIVENILWQLKVHELTVVCIFWFWQVASTYLAPNCFGWRVRFTLYSLHSILNVLHVLCVSSTHIREHVPAFITWATFNFSLKNKTPKKGLRLLQWVFTILVAINIKNALAVVVKFPQSLRNLNSTHIHLYSIIKKWWVVV